jgi:hypothetical protein
MMKSHTLSRLSVKTLLGEQEDKENIKAEGLLSKAFFETVRTTWKVTDKSPATAEMIPKPDRIRQRQTILLNAGRRS